MKTATMATMRVSRWTTCQTRAGELNTNTLCTRGVRLWRSFSKPILSSLKCSSEEEPEKGKLSKAEEHPKGQKISVKYLFMFIIIKII